MTYTAYKSEWLYDIEQAENTIEKGRQFAIKLITQWLDNTDLSENMFFCDGSGDGGIDIAVLDNSSQEINEDSNTKQGNTWYIIQSKYGSAFSGVDTLLSESHKVITTLQGKNKKLNDFTASVVEKIQNFRQQASDLDKIILLFATENHLTNEEKEALNSIRILGRNQLGDLFDVDNISIEMIYERLEQHQNQEITLPFHGNVTLSGENLLVGSISLINLYQFLSEYRKKTGDLDRIYEKNVRRFLGADDN